MKKSLIYLFSALAIVATSCKEKEPVDPYADRDAALTSFSFKAEDNKAFLLFDVEGEIKDQNINVLVPAGTKITSLVATFTMADKESVVTVSGENQVSGQTVNDFSANVQYIVSLGDKKNTLYTVKVSFLPAAQWTKSGEIAINAGYLRMALNNSGNPVFAVLENAGSSRGPLKIFKGTDAEPVVASPEDITCQYLSFGIGPNDKMVAFCNDYQSTSANRKGMVLVSDNGTSFTRQDVVIDYSNAYYGTKVGFYNKDIFVMTCNNAAGAVAKRAMNITHFDGAAWSTGDTKAFVEGAQGYYFPQMTANSNGLYCMVTNMHTTDPAIAGMTIMKYDGTQWTEVISVSKSASEMIDKYAWQPYEAQDFVANEDGTFYIACGNAVSPYVANVIKVNPSAATAEGKMSVLGQDIEIGTSSIAARYARMAVSPLGKVYFAYLTGEDTYTLNVTQLNEDTLQWENPAVIVADRKISDYSMQFNAKGEAYLSFVVGDVTDPETKEVLEPAHIELWSLK